VFRPLSFNTNARSYAVDIPALILYSDISKLADFSRGIMKYVPALDGIRALAVMLTVLLHSEVPGFGGGAIGVDIFFVLSGFLITTLLMDEIKETKRVNYLHFYLRRGLRLYPALLLLLIAGAVALVPMGQLSWKEIIIAGAYLTDYAIALGYVRDDSMLTHTWSLAVEEHFYILWPLILAWLCRRKKGKDIVKILGWAYVVTTFWKFGSLYTGQTWEQVYFRFDTRISGLMLGAYLAACRHHGVKIRGTEYLLPLSFIALVECVLVVPFRHSEATLFTTIPAELFAFFAIAKILDEPKSRFVKWFSLPVPVYIGRISYGVYLFHATLAQYVLQRYEWYMALPIVVAGSIALASASFYTVELLARNTVKKFHLRAKRHR
jgi:peptidoglycan/LPS O-acetylase OafA/YrhL